jgi:hypothetical protein
MEDIHVFNNLSIVTGDGDSFVAMQDAEWQPFWLEEARFRYVLSDRLDVRGGP